MEATRRGFLGTAGALAAGAAAGAAGASAGGARAARAAEAGAFETRYACDVLVAGAGVGGLAAALTAAQAGASVVLVEASAKVGGTSRFAAGSLGMRLGTDWDEILARAPLTDKKLGKLVLDRWPEFLEWVRGLGVPTSDMTELSYGGSYFWMGGMRPEPDSIKGYTDEYLQAFGQLFTEAGGTTLTSTRAVDLVQDAQGHVTGMVCADADGYFQIDAKATILATGGFQQNKAMLAQYCGPNAEMAVGESVPYLTGDGIIMAERAGAKLSRSMPTFYGHPVPYPWDMVDEACDPATYEQMDVDDCHNIYFGATPFMFQSKGIIVNLDGRRFADETRESFQINREISQQKFSRAFIVIDQAIRDSLKGSQKNAAIGGEDRIEWCREHGAPVIEADTIEGLAEAVAAWTTDDNGFNPVHFLDEVEEFNRSIDEGTTAHLAVPKGEAQLNKIETGPFYAFPVTCGIMATFGGVQIDEQARVISRADLPIEGLYAIPGCAGGIMNVEYWCVMSGYSVLGRLAAQEAAKFATGE